MPKLLHYSNPESCKITQLLSQYELLQSLCQNLSSADIIHLAATCKTHWVYMASSKPTLGALMSTAQCDGSGIVAQARIFGYWKGDPSNATNQCLGADAEPCSSCGIRVCDVRNSSRIANYGLTRVELSVSLSLRSSRYVGPSAVGVRAGHGNRD